MSAQIFIACDTCGEPMPVDEELVKNSLAMSGTMPTARHDTCPGAPEPETDEVPPRRFRCDLIMVEIPADIDDTLVDEWVINLRTTADAGFDVLSSIGHTVTGRNFAEAVNGPLTVWLNKMWPQFQESAAFADLPDPTPTTGV